MLAPRLTHHNSVPMVPVHAGHCSWSRLRAAWKPPRTPHLVPGSRKRVVSGLHHDRLLLDHSLLTDRAIAFIDVRKRIP